MTDIRVVHVSSDAEAAEAIATCNTRDDVALIVYPHGSRLLWAPRLGAVHMGAGTAKPRVRIDPIPGPGIEDRRTALTTAMDKSAAIVLADVVAWLRTNTGEA